MPTDKTLDIHEMAGDDAIMTTMGFTSFGQRSRDQCRVKQLASKNTNVHALAQLMPGTELGGKYADFSMDSIEHGPYGAVSLLYKEAECNDIDSLEGALAENIKENSEVDVKAEHPVPYSAVLEELEREKSKFNAFKSSQFLSARSATNAFETLGRHRFLNRSAMKLVTLDHIFQWTRSISQRQKSLHFADICGGPGGFSEYLLWRADSATNEEGKHSRCVHGYGITLMEAANNCDWRLPSEFRDLFTICYGKDGTGNLYSLANIRCFRDVVRAHHPSGVDLVVADGGFQDARSQSNQVRDTDSVYVCEVRLNVRLF